MAQLLDLDVQQVELFTLERVALGRCEQGEAGGYLFGAVCLLVDVLVDDGVVLRGLVHLALVDIAFVQLLSEHIGLFPLFMNSFFLIRNASYLNGPKLFRIQKHISFLCLFSNIILYLTMPINKMINPNIPFQIDRIEFRLN